MFRDMTFIDDIIKVIFVAINFIFEPKNQNKNEIFNLGNDEPIKTSYLLNRIENMIGEKALVKHCKTKNENFKTHADISKAKNLLRYDPSVTLDEGMKKFLDWHNQYEN